MTNREYIIALLSGKDCIDDNGANYESMVNYHISCPYFEGDERGYCGDRHINEIDREMCFGCKENWLNSELEE